MLNEETLWPLSSVFLCERDAELCFSLLITTRFCSFVNIVRFVEITFEIIPRKLLCCFVQYVGSDDMCVR